MKNNLKSEFREAKNIQGAKSISSREREMERIKTKNKRKSDVYKEKEVSSEEELVEIVITKEKMAIAEQVYDNKLRTIELIDKI